jgi:hypothetical protein
LYDEIRTVYLRSTSIAPRLTVLSIKEAKEGGKNTIEEEEGGKKGVRE